MAPIGAENEGLSSPQEFEVNFVTRQNLNLIEDLIIDAQVILQTMATTVAEIRGQCCKFGQMKDISEEEEGDLQLTMGELNDDVKEMEMLEKRAKLLREKAESTTRLVSFYARQTIDDTADTRTAC